MVEILVTYYTRGGSTERLAQAVADGVRSAGGIATLKPVDEVDASDLPGYDGIIIGSPVYFGTMASEVKKLIDDSIAVRGRLEGKVGAAFTTSRHRTGGKETTLLSILEAMLIHGMVVCGDPISVGGHYGAAGADAAGVGEGVALGARVARVAETNMCAE